MECNIGILVGYCSILRYVYMQEYELGSTCSIFTYVPIAHLGRVYNTRVYLVSQIEDAKECNMGISTVYFFTVNTGIWV
jgi:hypothetical protein